MTNKIIFVPIGKVKEYLKKIGFYRKPTAAKVRDIFLTYPI